MRSQYDDVPNGFKRERGLSAIGTAQQRKHGEGYTPLVRAIVNQKYVLVGDIAKECEAIITPDPKADYTLLAQRAPKLTAMSDYIDKTLFESSPGIWNIDRQSSRF